MLRRCSSPKHKSWADYGGRGIRVCERWLSFDNFVEDMHPTYQDDLTIDRIDVNGPYTPENCRWATKFEQGQNTRRIHYVTVGNRTQSVSAWLREIGMSATAFYGRVRRGEDPATVLTSPRPATRDVSFKGRTQTIAEWSRELNIRSATIGARLRWGWPVERALSPQDFRF